MSAPARFPIFRYLAAFFVAALGLALPFLFTTAVHAALTNAESCTGAGSAATVCMVAIDRWILQLFTTTEVLEAMLLAIPLGEVSIALVVVVCLIHCFLWRRKLAKAD